ncbi:hypothetical protein Nepgr_022614 [Nepenthes gracilis]|uniref:ABC-type xenobiotic transporter n=1 Tax=Nepenthes gracilis TaxID=150966 RepID=A0AAD3XWZ2_NEPGR|nr:hypothetical protein Nepgr_022614 [Nepenthes gracilis]
MEIALDLVNVAFCIALLAWVLADMLKYRGDGNDMGLEDRLSTRNSSSSAKIVQFCNAIISVLYLCFGFYEFWYHRTHWYRSISSAPAWILATLVSVYSRSQFLTENKWPLVLRLWWVYSTVYYLFLITIYSVSQFTSISFHIHHPKERFVDFLACPFSILLSFSALPIFRARKHHDLEHPLLKEKKGSITEGGHGFSNAGTWSHLTFSWLNPLFKVGKAQKLELSNIPSIPQTETAENATCLLEESLQNHKISSSSLSEAIFHSVWKSLTINAIFAGANTIASCMGPLLITHFVDYLSKRSEDRSYWYGIILAVIFFIAKSIESLSQRQWYFGASRIGTRIRAALMVLIYKKSISIKYSAPADGKIINFINVDAERIGDFCRYIHGIWLLPLQVLFSLVILYMNLGAASSIAALSTTIFVMICNTPLANRQEMLHSKVMEAKDLRIKATSEILKSMRVLKLHSWESTFLTKLLKLREKERSWLSKYLYTCSAVAFLFWTSPTLVSVVTFGVCILVKTPLTSSTVLSALATFRILQEPIYNLPELISMIAQTKVSIDRIENFICDEDQKKFICYQKFKASSIVIDIETGEYAWNPSGSNLRKPTVKISKRMKIKKGDKVGICGSVGSGKSSLLCSILSEIPRISGTEIKVLGTKAYVPQSAWIQTGTVRENILFGKEMNKDFYEEVLEGCALNKDIQMWADGDLCVVGERGMNLSGGQKQRVQLARAIYSESDAYFLDDPFSAVDAHTGAHVFKRCLMQLLSEKTVVYVTHQLEFLDAADLVLVMKDGVIVQSGKFEDLIVDPESELARHVAAHSKSLNQVNQHQAHDYLTKISRLESRAEVIEENSKCLITYDGLLENRKEEEEESGSVNWHVYSSFITAAYRGALVPVILLCQLLFQGLQMSSNYWLAWAIEEEQVSRKQLIGIFVLLSGGGSIFIFGRTFFLSTIALETSKRLFLDMIRSVFRAPISFFDSSPSSRILNRASTDQSVVDTDIPYRLAGLAFALIQLLSVIVLMSQIAWQIFLLFIAIIAISMRYQAYYITTARELARMIGVRKAPILHHFSETITGLLTIRCFNQEGRFCMKILSLVDDYSRVAFHNSAAMEWLSVRINFLFNLVFLIVLVILVTMPRSAIDPSLSGLAATYGLNLNVLQAWVIWNLCNVENKMISVERILQFSCIPSEGLPVIEGSRPGAEWPSKGIIEFANLHVRYSPALPMVLKGITFTLPGQKKIGIVGRTGSGKSTLIQALFRVVEPSEGQILIDGVDICKIGLQDLRSRLSIIPQDPTLFQGMVRANLDPFQEHSDQEIWEVLGKCRLTDIVRQDERLLDAPVTEDGESWSVGQRQLVCLARVLLQKRRILVLDEATASVDSATDNIMQKTITEETSRCTVITVAHRIPTVIDNDLVLVLDEGKIIEYDSPAELLRNSNSAFSRLVVKFSKSSSMSNHHWNLT